LAQDRQEWQKAWDGSLSVSSAAQILEFIVRDVSIVSVDHRIRPDTVATVLGHDVQQAA